MGSASGRYKMKDVNSLQDNQTNLPSPLSNSDGSKRKNPSFPTFLHQNSLTDLSKSTNDNLIFVWLDTEMNTQPINIDIQIKLKNLINHLRIFDEINSFEQYVKQIGQVNKDQLILIISPALSLTIIPYIHNLSQIKYIYIYGKAKIDTKVQQDLIKKYPKVKGIFSKCQYLLAKITEDENSTNI